MKKHHPTCCSTCDNIVYVLVEIKDMNFYMIREAIEIYRQIQSKDKCATAQIILQQEEEKIPMKTKFYSKDLTTEKYIFNCEFNRKTFGQLQVR